MLNTETNSMHRLGILFFILCVIFFTQSANAKNQYHLSELKFTSESLYATSSPTVFRHYLHFRNTDGNQYFITDEDSNSPQPKEIQSLLQAMKSWKSSCTIDLECTGKAFCTGECRNLYYQISNQLFAGNEKANRCRLLAFTCSNPSESGAGAK